MSDNLNKFDNYNTCSSDNSLNEEDYIYSGLVLKNNYILLKKIGVGANANIWMIYNIVKGISQALKIQNYESYNDGCKEVVIIKKINSTQQKYNQSTHCIKMLDYFTYEGGICKFACMLFELYGGSIETLLTSGKYKYGFPINVVKKITLQIIDGLLFLHNKIGVIHTDIKPSNILIRGINEYHLQIFNAFLNENFQDKYLELKKQNLSRGIFKKSVEILALNCVKNVVLLHNVLVDTSDEECSETSEDYTSNETTDNENSNSDSDISDITQKLNSRSQSVDDTIDNLNFCDEINLDKLCDENNNQEYDFNTILNNSINSTEKNLSVIDDVYIDKCNVVISDFGNSYFLKNKTKDEIQDRSYRAPEIILNLPQTTSCDVWSLGCTVYEMLTGYKLFCPVSSSINMDLHHLYLIEKILGDIPIAMKKKSSRCQFLFDATKSYKIKNVLPSDKINLSDILRKQFLFSTNDSIQISDFIQKAVCIDPNNRWSLNQLKDHKWLVND